VASVSFQRSDDGITWTNLGNATRVAATSAWTLNATVATPVQPGNSFYLRARAVVATGGGTSSGLTEAVREINAFNQLAAEVLAVSSPSDGGSTPATPTTPPAAPNAGTIRQLNTVAALTEAITAAQLATTPGTATLARLSNLSTRAQISAASPLLTGFAITGTGDRTVLLRAVGPGLTTFGVNGVLAAPRLQLFDATGALVLENTGWSASAAVTQAGAVSGAFPLTAGSADSAFVVTLPPGAYSIQVSDSATSNTGIALAEIYDVAGGSTSRLVNVSSRGSVSATETALISGFVIAGTTSENLLVRGVGPGLTAFGVTGALADPQVGLYDSTGRLLAANDNWSGGNLSTTATGVGAFALASGSKDAALVMSLAPGAYTAQVSGTAAASAGGVLLEIYEVK
jgi:hypothetical protein